MKLEVFFEKGYENTSIRMIQSKIGREVGSFYYHFSSKDDVMEFAIKLFLREMTLNDYNALYTVLADSDIMQHYPYVFDQERVTGWILKNIERYKVFGFGLWAVVLKETGEMIGDCGLTMQRIHDQIKPEIGYHIRKDCQRKGF